MNFIPENYTFIEAVFLFLTAPITMTAGTVAFTTTTLLLTHHMNNKPNPSSFKTWSVGLTLGFVSGMLISLLFALQAASIVDPDKGYYEATGTIEKIEYHSEYAGQTDGDYTISLKLDNGDPVDIQMPLQSPESIEPGDDFTLQSETLFDRHEIKDFTPIEKLHYSPGYQSLRSDRSIIPRFTIDFIVDGDVVKGHSD